LKSIGNSTHWFENRQKLEIKNNKIRSDKNIMKEWVSTTQEIKLRRKQRLLELYLIETDL
jgi:hypothetical protein